MQKQLRSSKSIRLIVVLSMLQFFVMGQDNSAVQGRWRYRVEPYMMFPNMTGSSGISGLPLVNINASASDILSKLQWGAMLNAEATNGSWVFSSDILYMDLGKAVKSSGLVRSGEIGAQQLGWELAALRTLRPWMDVGIGLLWNNVQVKLDIEQNQLGGGTLLRSAKQRESWLDPMVMVRLKTSPDMKVKKFFGTLRAEIGGFGLGSDLAWQVQAIGGYRFSRLFDMSAGLRAISLDYQNGSGPEAFVYDVVTSGPMVRFGFNF